MLEAERRRVQRPARAPHEPHPSLHEPQRDSRHQRQEKSGLPAHPAQDQFLHGSAGPSRRHDLLRHRRRSGRARLPPSRKKNGTDESRGLPPQADEGPRPPQPPDARRGRGRPLRILGCPPQPRQPHRGVPYRNVPSRAAPGAGRRNVGGGGGGGRASGGAAGGDGGGRVVPGGSGVRGRSVVAAPSGNPAAFPGNAGRASHRSRGACGAGGDLHSSAHRRRLSRRRRGGPHQRSLPLRRQTRRGQPCLFGGGRRQFYVEGPRLSGGS
mmetsp:Transcript_9036/g.19980  ORF Transcript_9036/g.19980 Transcript_9036/m.19980 type:complete len:268 (-) Transcript_9036:990-1793(-)